MYLAIELLLIDEKHGCYKTCVSQQASLADSFSFPYMNILSIIRLNLSYAVLHSRKNHDRIPIALMGL